MNESNIAERTYAYPSPPVSPLHVDEDENDDYRFVASSFIKNDSHEEDESDWLNLGIVDVEAQTEFMRQESKDRLRVKSNELKRFHDKICVRVTARERQNRLEAQRAQRYLDAKCAKLFSATESVQQTANAPAVRISTHSHFQNLKEQKKAVLKDCALGRQIDKTLRLDAQIRDELLQSIEISRSLALSDDHGETIQAEIDNSPAKSPTLLPEQRVALYALVRRQYMEKNRANAQSNVWKEASQPTNVKSPVSSTSIAAAVHGSRARRAGKARSARNGDRLTTASGIKMVDITSGCEARVHRQTTISSTPWRKKSKGATTPTAAVEHGRFVRALQAQLGTPALCSCGKAGSKSPLKAYPCANNCALYKQPKKREKLLVNVYKQQQQDTPTASASPMR